MSSTLFAPAFVSAFFAGGAELVVRAAAWGAAGATLGACGFGAAAIGAGFTAGTTCAATTGAGVATVSDPAPTCTGGAATAAGDEGTSITAVGASAGGASSGAVIVIVVGRVTGGRAGSVGTATGEGTSSCAALVLLRTPSESSECTKSTPATITPMASNAIIAAATEDAVTFEGAGCASGAPRREVLGPIVTIHGLSADESWGCIDGIDRRIEGIGAATSWGCIECIDRRIECIGAPTS